MEAAQITASRASHVDAAILPLPARTLTQLGDVSKAT